MYRGFLLIVVIGLAGVLARPDPARTTAPVDLREGWNRVVYEGEPASAGRQARLLADSAGGDSAIYVYDSEAGDWRGHHSLGPSFASTLPVLVPGREYWVFVQADVRWEFPEGALDLIAFTLTASVAGENSVRPSPRAGGPLRTAITVIRPEGGPTATLASFDGLSGGFAWSSAGTRMAWCSNQGLETALGDGTGRETRYKGPCEQPAWSDDDRYLAFVVLEAEGSDIVRLELQSGTLDNLTGDPEGGYTEPTWRPETDEVYAVRKGEPADFEDDRLVLLTAGEEVEALAEGGVRRDIAFSPDGEYIYSTGQDAGKQIVRALQLSTKEEEIVVRDGRAPAVSPDGGYLAWREPNFVRVRARQGGETLAPVVADKVTSHAWSQDSTRLVVSFDEGVQKGLLAVTTLSGPPRVIAHYPPLYVTEASWSPR